MKPHLVFTALLILSAAQLLPAADSELPTRAESVEALKARAEGGNPAAQFFLGALYYHGDRVTKDYVEAAKLFRKAADQGVSEAQFHLGVMISKGLGVEKRPAEAAQWYLKAAEFGHAKSQFNLGLMHLQGQGVSRDISEAVKWWRKAAEQGNAEAQFDLGGLYETGEGVPKDEAEAARWHRKAAEQGLAPAQFVLGLAYAEGRGVPRDEAEAVKWYRKAAEQGYASAQYNLGWMYDNGRGVPKNEAVAVKWWHKAAEQGNANAQYNLGLAYADGLGVSKAEAEAAKWWRKAAEQGISKAQYNLGLMCAKGEGVPKNLVEAHAWSSLAATTGNRNASSLRSLLEKVMTQEEIATATKLAREREWSVRSRTSTALRAGIDIVPGEEPVSPSPASASRPASPSTAYEKFQALAKSKNGEAIHDMLSDELKKNVRPMLQALAPLISPSEVERWKRLDGPELLAAFFDKQRSKDGYRWAILEEKIESDRASLQVLTIVPGDVQIQDIRLVRESGAWKFFELFGMRDPLNLPKNPTVSASAAYRAFLALRDKNDWEAVVELLEKSTRSKMAEAMRARLLAQTLDRNAVQAIKEADDRTLLSVALRSAGVSGSKEVIEIVGEKIDGTKATLNTSVLKAGGRMLKPVMMEWKSGVWWIVQ